MPDSQKTIGVIGAGAWGTALAQTLCKERDVLLWAMEAEVAEAINTKNENTVFLPGLPLDSKLQATNNIDDVLERDILLLVSPAQFIRTSLENIKDKLKPNQPIIICAKGVELESGLLMTQVAAEVVPDQPIGILTGPTFASDIAAGLPAAVTIAMENQDMAKDIQHALGVTHFRPYITKDVIGAQLGGAIKNVIAIACGIVEGRRLGESARAALVTRGVAEIARLGVAMGSKRETLLGMCGIGDIMLTCSSMQSRNFSLGAALGEGKTLQEVLGKRISVTEGVHTAKSTLALAKKNAVDMPITEAINKCLNEGLAVDDAIEEMFNRPFKYEMSSK